MERLVSFFKKSSPLQRACIFHFVFLSSFEYLGRGLVSLLDNSYEVIQYDRENYDKPSFLAVL